MNKKEIEYEKLRWACRRGMLELDLFLVPFFEACFNNLTSKEQLAMKSLLSATDPELLGWLMAHQAHEDKEVAAIVDKIRQYRLQQRPGSIL
ncbi:MAG: succinate dehydrogenase assembly factor 2 [Candidatus Berkiella sp.]